MKQQKGRYRLKKGVSEKIIHNDQDAANNAQDLTNKEMFGERSGEPGLAGSDDEEGANEGLGDGKIGRTTRGSGE